MIGAIHRRLEGLDNPAVGRYPRASGGRRRAPPGAPRGVPTPPATGVAVAGPPSFATLGAVTSRRLASAALALAAVLTLGACATRSPMQTTEPYSAADGVPVDLGTVQVRGLVIVSKAKGEAGVLVGQVVNSSGKAARLTMTTTDGKPLTTSAGAPLVVEAAPGSTSLGDAQVTLDPVDVIPGSVVRMAIQSDAGGTAQAAVPVLSPAGYYSTITPTAPVDHRRRPVSAPHGRRPPATCIRARPHGSNL